MALSSISRLDACRLIHHSDRGCQYCSHAYVEILTSRGVSISMTESGDPLENAVAERVNGILKREWIYKMTIPSIEECQSLLKRIINFYNNERPHMSIDWQTPAKAHEQIGLQKRCWRSPYAKYAMM